MGAGLRESVPTWRHAGAGAGEVSPPVFDPCGNLSRKNTFSEFHSAEEVLIPKVCLSPGQVGTDWYMLPPGDSPRLQALRPFSATNSCARLDSAAADTVSQRLSALCSSQKTRRPAARPPNKDERDAWKRTRCLLACRGCSWFLMPADFRRYSLLRFGDASELSVPDSDNNCSIIVGLHEMFCPCYRHYSLCASFVVCFFVKITHLASTQLSMQ